MADLPIIYSGPMVLAMLREIKAPGTGKTMTRRLLYSARKVPKSGGMNGVEMIAYRAPRGFVLGPDQFWSLSGWHKAKPGDRLWVRETCKAEEREDGLDGVRYLADQSWCLIENTREAADLWVDLNHYRKQRGAVVPPIHMPRWASRLALLVTAVKIERLQDISYDDIVAEGARSAFSQSTAAIPGPAARDAWEEKAQMSWQELWGSLHSKPGTTWDDNPWVVALSFEPVLSNIDSPEMHKERCPTCGAGVRTIFDHVAIDCEAA